MIVRTGVATLVAASILALSSPASAQDNALGGALIGGTAGATVGGAASGRAGGAAAGAVIGAAAGAMIASQMEWRRGRYYRYDNRCWYRYPSGAFRAVSSRRCR